MSLRCTLLVWPLTDAKCPTRTCTAAVTRGGSGYQHCQSAVHHSDIRQSSSYSNRKIIAVYYDDHVNHNTQRTKSIVLVGSAGGMSIYRYSSCSAQAGGKGKTTPLQACYKPIALQEVEAPRFQDNRQMKVVRLSALRTGRLYPPENIPSTYFH